MRRIANIHYLINSRTELNDTIIIFHTTSTTPTPLWHTQGPDSQKDTINFILKLL